MKLKMWTSPFSLQGWIDEHRANLQPPVGAEIVYPESNFVIMVVGGPNRRTDYHINETEEFFYQLRGDMCLKVVRDGEFVDVPIREGEIFLLPANVPHSPQRPADTVGLVVELRRTVDSIDRMRWYCAACRAVVREETLYVGRSEDPLNLGKALKPYLEQYQNDSARRTCGACGHVNV